MSKRIEVPMALETTGIRKGATDAERALKDLEDAVQDTGRSGAKDLTKLEDELKDVQRQSKKTETAVDGIGDGGQKGFGRAGDAAGEFKQEALQNLSEVVSSFDGDMQSIGDLAQGTFGGLAASLPGVLGAAGAGAAVGVGLITAAFVAADEQREALQERANDLANAYIEAGSTVLDAMTIASRSSEILVGKETRKQAEDLAKVLSVDLATAARALAGDQNALAVANNLVGESTEEWRELMTKAGTDAYNLTATEKARLDQLSEMREQTRELNGITEDANATFEAQQAVLRGLINEASSATKEVDELGNAVYTLPDGTQIMIDAETGQATTDVSKFKGDLDGIRETVTSKVKVEVDDWAWRNWRPGTKVGRVDARVGGRDVNSWE